MSRKTASVSLDGTGLRFLAQTGSGHRLVLDNEEGHAGPRPAELVPVALAACTAMDVISMLRKKRQAVTSYEVRAAAEQNDEVPHEFTRIDIVHVVAGPVVEVAAVRRAIELSATRYCSVGGTLSTGVTEIHHRYVVSTEVGEHEGEVVVTGPREDPRELGGRVRATSGAA